MIISRPKNVILERFWPLSKFHFPACSSLTTCYLKLLYLVWAELLRPIKLKEFGKTEFDVSGSVFDSMSYETVMFSTQLYRELADACYSEYWLVRGLN